MEGGNLVSNAIGLMKEVDDSRGGSGFCFTDLGADKVGTRFGQQVTSQTSASDLQQRLARSTHEQDFIRTQVGKAESAAATGVIYFFH